MLWLFLFGFVMFAVSVMREPERRELAADGIVVLTGGPIRIAEGSRLLAEGRARRLLISGVNPQTRREDLMRLSKLDRRTFDCCVDVGYEALDTIGNAAEARAWAAKHQYTRLVIVTSNYHMPRSLAEMSRRMPAVELLAHPVMAKSAGRRPWWVQPRVARDLASEYLKFLPAAARLAVSRIMGSWRSSALAEAPERKRA
jgi:uncharacterized SAM-binding protein YcdF (DUF218 family)